MTLTHFEVIQGDEHLTSHSGLALVGALLERSGLRKACDGIAGAVPVRDGFSLGELGVAMTGLICLGKPDFDAIEEQRAQPFFAQSLGLPSCPSSPTLRQRLQAAESSLDDVVRKSSREVIGRTARRISGIHSGRHGELVPFEMDVVVFDNSKTQKEGVAFTYHKNMGFAPIFTHIGCEGYMVDVLLREGNKHSQDATTPAFLRSSLQYAREILGDSDTRHLYARFDAGFDSQENLTICEEKGVYFTVSRNRRNETIEHWLEIAKRCGAAMTPRPGKTVWIGETTKKAGGIDRRVIFEVIERTSKRVPHGFQQLIMPEYEIETLWTNLEDTPQEVLDSYHGRGTSEQFHSEIKTDLDLERLPSGTFATNQLILLFGMLSYNCLRLIGQEAICDDPNIPQETKAPLRKSIKRRRIRSVIDDLIHMAARVIHSARRWKLAFGRHCPWAKTWARIYESFFIPIRT